MSDNPGAAAAALAGGETQPTTTEPATTTAVPGSVQPTKAPGSVEWVAPEWAKDLPAEDLGYLEKKRLHDPKDLFKSYRELERTLSQDKIVLPKDGADPKEWDAVYNRLGRPESPDKYAPPKDADPELFKALAPELHGAGLTQAQLDKVAGGYNKYAQQQMEAAQNQWLKDQEAAQSKLEREWGANTPAEIEHNRRALRALGMSIAEASTYMRAGSEKFLRLLNIAGHAIAEDNSGSITSDETLGFGLTPNRAAAEKQAMMADKDFMARVHRGDPAAKAKYNRVVQAMADGGVKGNVVRTVRR